MVVAETDAGRVVLFGDTDNAAAVQAKLRKKPKPKKRKPGDLFFAYGTGLKLQDWVRICGYLQPEDVLMLRETCSLFLQLFPHVVQVLLTNALERLPRKHNLLRIDERIDRFFDVFSGQRIKNCRCTDIIWNSVIFLEILPGAWRRLTNTTRPGMNDDLRDFFGRVKRKELVKPCWKQHLDPLVVLLQCYQSVMRGRAITNLGWYSSRRESFRFISA